MRNRFSLRAVEFVCGEQASFCSNAFHDWLGALPRSFDQLVKDGPTNKWNDLNVGYNSDAISGEFETTLNQLYTYSMSLDFAITGAATNTALKAKPNALPPPDFVSQFYVDDINSMATELMDSIKNNY